MDMCLDPENPYDANIRAALALAFQGLLRSSEFALNPGKTWNHKVHVARGDERERVSEGVLGRSCV
jgi:hypothetical protein